MKSFDRACIYILIWLGVLNVCAFIYTKESAVVAIASTAVFFVLLVYENRISYYEERSEYYRNLFMEQNKAHLATVLDYTTEKKEKMRYINIGPLRRQRQKSGIDNSKVS